MRPVNRGRRPGPPELLWSAREEFRAETETILLSTEYILKKCPHMLRSDHRGLRNRFKVNVVVGVQSHGCIFFSKILIFP